MFNFLIFMFFDFVPALFVYCSFAAVVAYVYKKKKIQKQLKEKMQNIKKEVKNNENK